MASSCGPPWEDQICSICLETFTDPVSTPCGHNFCKSCITGYWDSSELTQCPLCKSSFSSRPRLQVNTRFRDMVEHFNSMRVQGGDEIHAQPGDVSCDICLGPKLKAQKTCLVCLASYCQSHLEPHWRVANLKKHKLTDPVSNLEDRVCKKHDKMLELYCCTDQVCVCFMCLKDDHVTHEAVPLEHVFRERKAWLETVTSEMKRKENSISRSVKETKHSVRQSKKGSKREIADIVQVLSTLVASLQKSQAELIELVGEKQKAAETQAEDHVTRLEQEAAELRKRRSEIEQLLRTDDHLLLLQRYPSLLFHAHPKDLYTSQVRYIPPFTRHFSDISGQVYVAMVKKSVAQMEKTLSNDMEMLIHEVRLSDGCEAPKQADPAEKVTADCFIKEVWNPPQDKLMMIQQCDAVDVTLDAYTANSRLAVSEDGKQVSFCKNQQFFPPLFRRRFYPEPFVLATDGFSSGRFYYEVRVSGSATWVVGVVKESYSREHFGVPTPDIGGWTFSGNWTKFQDEYWAPGGLDFLYPNRRPQTVGVFVDYEKGEVSFYDVDARTLIYSFTGCTFTETTPGLKAFLYSVAGAPLSSRPKLYPIFGIFNDCNDDVLEITPVGQS